MKNNALLYGLIFLLILWALLSGVGLLKVIAGHAKGEADCSNGTPPTKRTTTAANNNNNVPPLSELTRNPTSPIECPEPLVPLYDRIVPQNNNYNDAPQQKIPKIIHMAWIRKNYHELTFSSRCISQDLMEIPQIWMKQFPSYSFYFHDDYAVDTLLNQYHPEFPQLPKLLKACVLYGSAMKVDIWRQLVMYYYGGIYSDMDDGPLFDETEIHPEDTFWSLNDDGNRTSQWMFGMEAHHPMSYFTMLEIMSRLTAVKDVSFPKLIYVTGPEAMRTGYMHFLQGNGETRKGKLGTHISMFGEVARKLDRTNKRFQVKDDIVEWPRGNFSTHNKKITKKERIEREMNTEHWTTTIRKKGAKANSKIPKESCLRRLHRLDNNKLI